MSDHILWILLALLLGILIGWLLHRIFSAKKCGPFSSGRSQNRHDSRTGTTPADQATAAGIAKGIRNQLQTRLEELQQETAAIHASALFISRNPLSKKTSLSGNYRRNRPDISNSSFSGKKRMQSFVPITGHCRKNCEPLMKN